MRSKVGKANPGSGITNEGHKFMGLIVEWNGCVEWKVTGVVEKVSLETIERGMEVGEEGFEEPAIRVEDTVETLNEKEVEPTLTVIDK